MPIKTTVIQETFHEIRISAINRAHALVDVVSKRSMQKKDYKPAVLEKDICFLFPFVQFVAVKGMISVRLHDPLHEVEFLEEALKCNDPVELEEPLFRFVGREDEPIVAVIEFLCAQIEAENLGPVYHYAKLSLSHFH
jgi:hypothetical protein